VMVDHIGRDARGGPLTAAARDEDDAAADHAVDTGEGAVAGPRHGQLGRVVAAFTIPPDLCGRGAEYVARLPRRSARALPRRGRNATSRRRAMLHDPHCYPACPHSPSSPAATSAGPNTDQQHPPQRLPEGIAFTEAAGPDHHDPPGGRGCPRSTSHHDGSPVPSLCLASTPLDRRSTTAAYTHRRTGLW
jgi:hypothetical protein